MATVPLNFLCHGLEFEQESVTIIDIHAKHCGYLSVAIIPCDANGKELVNSHVDDPMDLVIAMCLLTFFAYGIVYACIQLCMIVFMYQNNVCGIC